MPELDPWDLAEYRETSDPGCSLLLLQADQKIVLAGGDVLRRLLNA